MEKEVFSWRAEKVQICCIFKWKSRFSRDAPKRCKFAALLHGKAGFLVTRQKGPNLLQFLSGKACFSWRAKKGQICCIFKWKTCSWLAKKVQIWCIFKWKSRFSRDAPKLLILVHYYVKSRFSRDAPNRCKFVAFLSGKAGFLVTRQNG